MRTLILPFVVAAAAGCGGSANLPTFTVGTQSLVVADEGYYSSLSTDFCSTGGRGQLKLDFVDYGHICDPMHLPDRNPNSPHTELRVILNIGVPPNYADNYPGHPGQPPYPITPGDCTNGQGTDQAQFLHYPLGATDPDTVTQADSGTVTITKFDPNNANALEGMLDLKFGSSEIKNTFKLDYCN